MSALHWPTGPERDFVAVRFHCTTKPPTTNRVINLTISKGFNGAGNRIRTRDPLITNQVLYQLSYTGKRGPFSMVPRIAHPLLRRFPAEIPCLVSASRSCPSVRAVGRRLPMPDARYKATERPHSRH